MAEKERVEDILARHLTEAVGEPPTLEYMFHPYRRWRLDISYPKLKFAVELDGFRYHSSIKAQRNDKEKRNALTEMGWKCLVYPSSDVFIESKLNEMVAQCKRVLFGVDSTGDLT